MARPKLLKAIIVLSFLGLFTSLYLLWSHYNPSAPGTLCNFGENFSCSFANSSSYSKLFNVPVALFGALWFLILFFMARKAVDPPHAKVMFHWSILGAIFIGYMIFAEVALRTICIYCTFVHLLALFILVLSYYLYKTEIKPHPQEYARALRRWIVLIFFVYLLVVLSYFVVPEKVNQDSLAECLTEKGVKLYTSFRCGVCANTKEMFGSSYQFLDLVECHPQGPNSQWPLCQKKQITGTPTWILEPDGMEIKRRAGFLSLEDLREFAGCE